MDRRHIVDVWAAASRLWRNALLEQQDPNQTLGFWVMCHRFCGCQSIHVPSGDCRLQENTLPRSWPWCMLVKIEGGEINEEWSEWSWSCCRQAPRLHVIGWNAGNFFSGVCKVNQPVCILFSLSCRVDADLQCETFDSEPLNTLPQVNSGWVLRN